MGLKESKRKVLSSLHIRTSVITVQISHDSVVTKEE